MPGVALRRLSRRCAGLVLAAAGGVQAAELPFEPAGTAAALGPAAAALGQIVPGANPALLGDIDRVWATLELGVETSERAPQRVGLAMPASERAGIALDVARARVGTPAGSTSRDEWRLGAGRRLRESLAAGALLRLRHDRWDDSGDTSHGLDLGVHARRGAVQWGAVTRGAVRPRVQSAAGAWQEPRALHTAVAVTRSLRGLEASLTAGLATSTSARGQTWGGVHVRGPHGAELALGASAHAARAGLGLRAGATQVEIVGERGRDDGWVAAALRLQFGPSRRAQRVAADQRADDAFSTRLGREIEVRQARRVEDWLDEAAQATIRGDHPRAVVLYRNVLLLDADTAAARDGLARAQRALRLQRADSLIALGEHASAAGALESILEQFPGDSLATQRLTDVNKTLRRRDRSRSEAVEQLRLGLEAFALQQYPAAMQHLENVCARDPDNATAIELLGQARAAHERQVAALLAAARARLDDGDPDAARRQVESVLALAPNQPQAAALRTEIERESERLAMARRAAAVPPPEETLREDRAPVPPAVLASGYEQGMRLYRAGDLIAAMRAWEDLAQLAPHYSDVDQYLLRVYRVCGLERYTEGRLQDAIEIWEKALRLEPNNNQVRRYLNQANAKMKRAHEPRGRR